jgi:hypothetical protein
MGPEASIKKAAEDNDNVDGDDGEKKVTKIDIAGS